MSDVSERKLRQAAWRTAAAAALVLAAGAAATYWLTDGLRAYTLESARRLAALRSPHPVPDLALDVVGAGRKRLSELPGRVLLVDFIYTNCTTYCLALGSIYARLQKSLGPEIAAGEVRLVTISFDLAHDGPRELEAYRARHSREPAGWDVAQPADAGELSGWLKAFGVVVIADGFGGFSHNAAVHVLGPDRKLAGILDLDDLDGIVRRAREVAGGTEIHAALR